MNLGLISSELKQGITCRGPCFDSVTNPKRVALRICPIAILSHGSNSSVKPFRTKTVLKAHSLRVEVRTFALILFKPNQLGLTRSKARSTGLKRVEPSKRKVNTVTNTTSDSYFNLN